MCVGQEKSEVKVDEKEPLLVVRNLLAIGNRNERLSDHETIDLVTEHARNQRSAWGSVHIDFFDAYATAREVYDALRAGKTLRCELRVLAVED